MIVQQKKSQATIFLMLGVIMVVVIFILLFVNKSSVKRSLNQEIIDLNKIPFTLQPINNFVEDCFSIVSKNSLADFNENSTEEELESFVKDRIDSCLDFSVFEEQGLSFSKKEIGVEVNINKKEAIFRMEYPIIIVSPGGAKTEIKDFLARHELILEEI